MIAQPFDNNANWKTVVAREKITYENAGISVWYNHCLHTVYSWKYNDSICTQTNYHESGSEITCRIRFCFTRTNRLVVGRTLVTWLTALLRSIGILSLIIALFAQ
jgi:hypothetical protein